MDRSPLHALAMARGIAIGNGCECVICGQSPFDVGDRRKRILGPNFSDYECIASPGADDVCAGCMSLLLGRPGDKPPPLRTVNAVVAGGQITYPDRGELWAVIIKPPADIEAVVWATSRKRHACLRAGPCTPERLEVGSDGGTIVFEPAHRLVAAAVLTLMEGFTRGAIASGGYAESAIVKFGSDEWAELEHTVSPHRGPLLDMLTSIAPKQDRRKKKYDDLPMFSGAIMRDPNDDRAALLLSQVAEASEYRRGHGKEFWGGVFRHRVERFKSLPLRDMVARLIDALAVEAASPGAGRTTEMLNTMSGEETTGCEESIRNRAGLVVALAYTAMKGRRIT